MAKITTNYDEEIPTMKHTDKQRFIKIDNICSIAQVVKLTGVSASMLRKYEEQGLLSPKRNKDNKYRQYSSSDINRILQIRQFRKLNISLDRIAELLNETDSEKNIETLQKYQEELRQRMQQEQVINGYLSYEIETIRNKGGAIKYRTLDPQIYQVFGDGSNLVLDSNRIEQLSWMLNEQPGAYLALLLPDYFGENYGREYQIVISSPDYYHQFQDDPRYEHLPGGQYAYTTVQMNLESLYDQIKAAEIELKEEGHSIDGRIIVEINPSPNVYTLFFPIK